MGEPRFDVEQAARCAAQAAPFPQQWNPVYRALVATEVPVPAPGPDPVVDEIVRRQFTARALLVVAVTQRGQRTPDESTTRLRIGVHPDGATLESSHDADPSTWSAAALEDVPARIAALLATAGIAAAAPRLTVEREAAGLLLTAQQIDHVRAELARGVSPADAFATAPGLDAPLRDALTARGPRIAVSLTLHDPSGAVAAGPVNWSRMWGRGDLGLYRMDSTGAAFGAVHPVADGDVLGTVLPILAEGVRFASACTLGDAR